MFGASDPLTGQVALMSEAKALGAAVPPGLAARRGPSSTPAGTARSRGCSARPNGPRTHAAELKRKALLYINTDGNGRGFLHAEGSHELQHFVNQAANDVTDPQTGVSAAERGRARSPRRRLHRAPARPRTRPSSMRPRQAATCRSARSAQARITPPSSSISASPSLNLGFGGEDESGGSYHSVYDSFYHVTHFDDPGLHYGAALSKVVGRLVLRAADAPRVPARYTRFRDDRVALSRPR